MRGGATADIVEFPNIEENIGENPAQFLDRPLIGSGPGVSSPFLVAKARIDGIDRLEFVNAWIAVERNPRTRGPRDKVLSLLKERKRYLEENGERPHDIDPDDETIPERYQGRRDVDPEDIPSEIVWPDREGGERSFLSVRSERRVATDGGEDS
jgi:hypothetical protein